MLRNRLLAVYRQFNDPLTHALTFLVLKAAVDDAQGYYLRRVQGYRLMTAASMSAYSRWLGGMRTTLAAVLSDCLWASQQVIAATLSNTFAREYMLRFLTPEQLAAIDTQRVDELDDPELQVGAAASALRQLHVPVYTTTTTKYDPYVFWVAKQINDKVRALRRYKNRRPYTDKTPVVSALTNVYRKLDQHLSDIVDWATATHVDIMTVSTESALRHSRAWHAELKAQHAMDEKKGAKTREVYAWPDGWRVLQLLNPLALDVEGNRLGHCVGRGTYYDQALLRGTSTFYAVRDASDHSKFTIELGHREQGYTTTIRQVRGKGNRTPRTQKECEHLVDFLVNGLGLTGDAFDHAYDLVDCNWHLALVDKL